MVLLILESLGSTELLFILVMALVFFGPRKLPQLSRSLGKNLAEFRKASEDFKRTWEKEVSLEEFNLAEDTTSGGSDRRDYRPFANEGSADILGDEGSTSSLKPPMIEAVPSDQVIARQPAGPDAFPPSDKTALESDQSDFGGITEDAKPSPKHDWL